MKYRKNNSMEHMILGKGTIDKKSRGETKGRKRQ